MESSFRYHLILFLTINSHTAQESHLTLRFSHAECKHSIYTARKMFEKHGIEASAASACYAPPVSARPITEWRGPFLSP